MPLTKSLLITENMKQLLFTLFLSVSLLAQAQKYADAQTLTLVGKANETPEFYHRLDTAKYANLPEKVKFLATLSPGLAVAFQTNSTKIWAEWSIKPDAQSLNMNAIAFKGLDLYIKRDGIWQFAAVGKPNGGNTNSELLIEGMDNSVKDCLLYLPVFSEVKSVRIGVESSAAIDALPYPFEKKVLVHGTSIVHGAEASRAGMTYPAQLARNTGWDIINFGFSGNARMENEMADCIADITADAYIIDCLPNTAADQIINRTRYMVEAIRKKHPNVPIFLMESIPFGSSNFNLNVKNETELKNTNLKQVFEKLQERGTAHLYYIEGDELVGNDQEGSGDGIHPNDLGFNRMVHHLIPLITPVLNGNTRINSQLKTDVSVFPNPTDGICRIQNKPDNIHAFLYNNDGRLLMETAKAEINMSEYPAGIYFLKTGNQTLKIIKENL
jgi:lysophospholipase L1-like esterase